MGHDTVAADSTYPSGAEQHRPLKLRGLFLDVSPRQPDGTIYVGASGDWNRSTAATARSVFRRVAEHQPALVIVDLGGRGRMDFAGLDVVVAAHRQLARSGGQLRLQNVPPEIQRLLGRR